MTDYTEIARRYIGAWNETDPTTRATLVGALFSTDASYVDPMAVAEGRETIAAAIAAVQDQFPGFTFRLAGEVDGHHDQVRFCWELGPRGEPATIVGFDVAVLDSDTRIRTVLGFLDRVPEA
jgi:hypothetical protein